MVLLVKLINVIQKNPLVYRTTRHPLFVLFSSYRYECNCTFRDWSVERRSALGLVSKHPSYRIWKSTHFWFQLLRCAIIILIFVFIIIFVFTLTSFIFVVSSSVSSHHPNLLLFNSRFSITISQTLLVFLRYFDSKNMFASLTALSLVFRILVESLHEVLDFDLGDLTSSVISK